MCVNDVADRGVEIAQNFNRLVTTDEQDLQNIIHNQVVENHRKQ